MFRNHLEIAVLGPITSEPLGVAASCVHCGAHAAPLDCGCRGFGPGCLVRPRENLTAVNRRPDESPLD